MKSYTLSSPLSGFPRTTIMSSLYPSTSLDINNAVGPLGGGPPMIRIPVRRGRYLGNNRLLGGCVGNVGLPFFGHHCPELALWYNWGDLFFFFSNIHNAILLLLLNATTMMTMKTISGSTRYTEKIKLHTKNKIYVLGNLHSYPC